MFSKDLFCRQGKTSGLFRKGLNRLADCKLSVVQMVSLKVGKAYEKEEKPVTSIFFSHFADKSLLSKVVRVFGKKSCVSTGVRKPGNAFASLTTMI